MKTKKVKVITSLIMLTIFISSFLLNSSSLFAAPSEGIKVSTKNISIDMTGKSAFVTVYLGSEDITSKADYITSNQKVAYGNEGRILARGKGTATISVSYNGSQSKISVTVGADKDWSTETTTIRKQSSISVETLSVSAAAVATWRNDIVNKAAAMVTTSWTPTKTLTGWRGRYFFNAGERYVGLPYSQTPNWKDDITFPSTLYYSDFYTSYKSPKTGYIMPRYGNDCSAFVSSAWYISRVDTSTLSGRIGSTYRKIGSYTNTTYPTQASLKASYPLLQTGDAVVSTANTHTFIIDTNNTNGQYVIAYEQTPPQTTISFWSYSDLAAGYYKPFSKY